MSFNSEMKLYIGACNSECCICDRKMDPSNGDWMHSYTRAYTIKGKKYPQKTIYFHKSCYEALLPRNKNKSPT